MQIIYRNNNNKEHNLSIKLLSFQENCKIAKLKPRFNKVTRSDFKNCRNILLLPLLSKIIKKSIHFQTDGYLKSQASEQTVQQTLFELLWINRCLTA